MSDSPKSGSRFPGIRRIWRPVAVTGAGGTVVAVWFEEIMLYAQEILALIFLPIMAGLIFLLDIFIFRSRTPKREDISIPSERGAK
ncbi:MAG TPA: hypothetical protein PKI78_07600 [Anaerolineales bacterium]|nr:hypothetical protein [Anaerolineales bacterium]